MKPSSHPSITLLSLLGLLAVGNPSQAADLIAHFPLDADGDSSEIGGFAASVVTDVTFDAPGATESTGTAATFNGSSSVIQHEWTADLNPESFTLALWARSEGGAGAWNSPVTSRHDRFADGEQSQGYLLYDNNPTGSWTFWSGNGEDPGNWQPMDGSEVKLGEWQHVVLLYDHEAPMKKLYVDGELVAESADTITPNDTTPFNIGAGQDFGDGFHFVGDLDDIGLWDGPLTEDEIIQVMESGVLSLTGGVDPNFDPDRDGDGIPNRLEEPNGLDPDVADSDSDLDNDGLTALVEINELKTDPTNPDTDGDGLLDGAETNTGTYVDASNTGTDPLMADTDGDGLADGMEVPGSADGPGTNPLLADTDGDGFGDGSEIRSGTDPLDAASQLGPLAAFFPLDADGQSSDGFFVPSLDDGVTYGDTGARPFTGNSARFEGDSVIQFEHSADLNPESFTLSVWVKSEGGAGAWNSPVTSRHDLFGQGEASQGYLIYDNNPSGVWTFWSGNGEDPGNWQTLDGPEVMLEQWQHLAIVYDDVEGMKKLYVDGELAVESEDTLTPNDTTPLNIGAGQDFGDGFHFIGNIDNLAIFRIPLGDDDIQNIYQNGVEAFLGLNSFRIESVARETNGDVQLSWSSFPGAFYDVERSTDLTPNSWQAILTDLPADPDPATVTTMSLTGLEGTANYLRVVRVPTPALFEDSFENGLGDWTVSLLPGGLETGTTWEAGIPTNGPGAAKSGQNVVGTGLTADYESGTTVQLRTPVIDPLGATNLRLSFAYYLEATSEEGGQVRLLEANGDEIQRFEPPYIGGDGNTETWTDASIRLPDLDPARSFIIEFVFLSVDDGNPDNNGAGWFLDDIRVGN